MAIPHHIHYQPYLQSLLSMSYIPTKPVARRQGRVVGFRLDEEDDDFVLIDRMFLNRGGVAYIKKIMIWRL